ncbi:unnamed protein product [Alopecurus aequalis]
MDDCVVFRYKGNSQFDVTIFDRFGREKASSVIVDNAPPPPHVQGRNNSGTENLERSHGHSQPMPSRTEYANYSEGRHQPMEMPSPTEYANRSEGRHQPMEIPSPTEYADRSEGRHQPMRMQPTTENLNRSEGHPQPMQMQSPTENLDSFAGFSRPMEMQPSTENVDNFRGHSQPKQMQPCTETVAHSNYQAQTVQMQLPHRRTERQSKLQRDYTSQGNKTAPSSSGVSLPSEDNIELCDTPRYTLGWNTSLNPVQKREVDEKVQSINSDNPLFVAVMKNFNVTGTFTLTFSKKYVKIYVGDKERSLCFQRLGKRWEVHFGGSPEVKRIVSGWRKFVQENDVEVGDICIFELLKIYEMCTMEVHIIHAKYFEGTGGDAPKTAERSPSRSQLVQMPLLNATVEDSPVHPQTMQTQSPSMEKEIQVQRDHSSQGNKKDSLVSEDSDNDTDALTGCLGVRLKHLTSNQKTAVKQKIQLIDCEIPICVVVMQKASVTGRFTLSISKKYVDRYLGEEARGIWFERHGQKWQLTLSRKPQNNRVVGGWAKFARDNELEEGDICLLELLMNCKLCAMKVHIIRAKNVG